MRRVGLPAGCARAGLRGPVGFLALALIAVPALALAAEAARAGCCDVVKVDAYVPPGPVRVCEPDASGQACGEVLFEADLELGARTAVCSAGDSILYQEIDPDTGAFAPPVTAVCKDADVEL